MWWEATGSQQGIESTRINVHVQGHLIHDKAVGEEECVISDTLPST